jgi:hypothetical protein
VVQQPSTIPALQQPSATAQNAATKNKRKKKKNVASSSSQSLPTPQMPFAQSQLSFLSDPSRGMVNAIGASSLVQSDCAV